jgi:hypothetical protein
MIVDFILFFFVESALQHVSMFIRSMNNVYQIIEPLFDFGKKNCWIYINPSDCFIGWRYNKNYFLAAKPGSSKDERYLLIWVMHTDWKKPKYHCFILVSLWFGQSLRR